MYHVFGWSTYYPNGWKNDLVSSHHSLSEATISAEEAAKREQWVSIMDGSTGKEVWSNA